MSLNVMTVGEGSPLLLLHGFTGTARTWTRQTPTWAVNHRVIAPDLLGHGASDAPADPHHYALEGQADSLAELLRLLEASPAEVVGYSMGARLALTFALAQPDVVSRLVLESPSAGIADPDERAARRVTDDLLAEDIERDGLEPFVDRWEALPLFASVASLPASDRERLRAERLSHDPRGLAASLRGAGQGAMTPLFGRLSEITVPTLVIAGALDPVGSQRARDIAASIPGARLEIISDAGHAPHLERPHEFTTITTEFLSPTHPTPTH
jgi:2-succinyl-6-hydroxy-2,4-cyclohexadiene-1-carboxylate synthase